MRSITALLGFGVGIAALAGCGATSVGAGGATTSTSPPSSAAAPPTSAMATPTPTPSVHFATSDAAMVYLAAAYNSGNETDLRHVTTPSARADLDSMRSDSTNLRLVSCTANTGRGDYTCVFDHDFVDGKRPSPDPEGPPPDGSKGGWAQLTVAPATSVGWYATVLESCD